jgi:hypothetical protein
MLTRIATASQGGNVWGASLPLNVSDDEHTHPGQLSEGLLHQAAALSSADQVFGQQLFRKPLRVSPSKRPPSQD